MAGSQIWVSGVTVCATCVLFRTGSDPGAPGARCGLAGLQIDPEIQGRIDLCIFPNLPRCRSRPLATATNYAGVMLLHVRVTAVSGDRQPDVFVWRLTARCLRMALAPTRNILKTSKRGEEMTDKQNLLYVTQ